MRRDGEADRRWLEGGARDPRLGAHYCCLDVFKATALGNALLQGIALGRFDDLAEGRRWLRSGAADPTSP